MPKRKAAEEGGESAPARGAEELADMSREVEERLVREVFRLVLFRHTQRLPTKRPDIKRVIGAGYTSSVVHEHVIQLVQRKFEKLCGLDMTEVQTHKKEKAFVLKADPQLAELVTTAPQPDAPRCGQQVASDGLLLAIVGAIALSPGAELKKGDRNHPQLGNVTARLASLVKQMYIEQEHQKVQQGGKSVVYRIGARGKTELVQPHLQSLLDELYGEAVTFELACEDDDTARE
jgi:hypothetical protein